ncbi:MAG: hypothetical protein V1684_02535 [bacterium]
MFFNRKSDQEGQLAEEPVSPARLDEQSRQAGGPAELTEEQLEKSAEEISLPDRPSGRQLKLGFWLTANRLLLHQSWVTFLIILSVLVWFYIGYRLIMLFTVEARQLAVAENSLTADLIDYQGYRDRNKPQPLAILGTNALSGSQQTDFFAKVKNPNGDWLATFDYRFVSGNDDLAWRDGWLLPGEEKYLLELAVKSGRQGGSPKVEIKNVDWQHLNKHQIPDYRSYFQDRFNFEIANINFIAAQESLVSDKVPISRVEFEITNNSAYNFWRVGCQVILKSGSRIMAVNYLALEQLGSGEKRAVSVDWYEQLPRTTQVEIIPEVNILDPAAYFDFEGGAGELK